MNKYCVHQHISHLPLNSQETDRWIASALLASFKFKSSLSSITTSDEFKCLQFTCHRQASESHVEVIFLSRRASTARTRGELRTLLNIAIKAARASKISVLNTAVRANATAAVHQRPQRHYSWSSSVQRTASLSMTSCGSRAVSVRHLTASKHCNTCHKLSWRMKKWSHLTNNCKKRSIHLVTIQSTIK